MYCKKCGKKNPEGSKFCQHCGIQFSQHPDSHDSHTQHNSAGSHISADASPYPYIISTWKLVIMSIATLGIYTIYWFYRQFKSFNAVDSQNNGTFIFWVCAIFSPLSSFLLFSRINKNLKEVNHGKGFDDTVHALVYFFLAGLWLGFVPLIFVQQKINHYWERKYSDRVEKSEFGLWNWITVIVSVFALLVIFSSEDTVTDTPTSSDTNIQTSSNLTQGYDQDEIASSVVNIFCPSNVSQDDSSGGSGTILTEEGIVLTNSHIIPQDKYGVQVDDKGCLVVLPDPQTGQPREIYLAHPIVVPDVSEKYDLAFMSIYDAYYDEDARKYMGTYPKKLPAFDDTTRCKNENVKLGEPVRILGYPSISGGYALTITDGIVSSFPGDGLIVTSAKISHGNSGGLAIDKDGCMLGVPSLVSSDDSESLGVIYSTELIRSFTSEFTDYLEN